jgi:hypothetical protein
MGSYYDNELVHQLRETGIDDYVVLLQPNNIAEIISKNFCLRGNRLDFVGLNHKRYVESSHAKLPVDAVDFVHGLIQDEIFKIIDKVIFIGDLTLDDYEFCLRDLLKILPYLMENIPQNHYFLLERVGGLIFVSENNELMFGIR